MKIRMCMHTAVMRAPLDSTHCIIEVAVSQTLNTININLPFTTLQFRLLPISIKFPDRPKLLTRGVM